MGKQTGWQIARGPSGLAGINELYSQPCRQCSRPRELQLSTLTHAPPVTTQTQAQRDVSNGAGAGGGVVQSQPPGQVGVHRP
jgi:hypothetical protein